MIKKCYHCDTTTSDSEKIYCYHCGKGYVKIEPCPKCHYVRMGFETYCQKCGVKL